MSRFEAALRKSVDRKITLPDLCAEILENRLLGRPIAQFIIADPDKLLPAALFLLLWIVGLAAAALALFQRQDLTRE